MDLVCPIIINKINYKIKTKLKAMSNDLSPCDVLTRLHKFKQNPKKIPIEK